MRTPNRERLCLFKASHEWLEDGFAFFWSRMRVSCVAKTSKFISCKTCLANIWKQSFNWSFWNICKYEFLVSSLFLSHKNRIVFSVLFERIQLKLVACHIYISWLLIFTIIIVHQIVSSFFTILCDTASF